MSFNICVPFTQGVTTPPPTIVAISSTPDRNTSTTTSIIQNIPAGVGYGQEMLAIVCANTNNHVTGANVTAPSGWSDSTGGYADNGVCGIYYFTKTADSTDAAGGNTYTWTLGNAKNLGSSMIITVVFRDAKIGLVQSATIYPTGSPASITWKRTVQNSLIVPVLYNTSTSTSQFSTVTDPSGFTRIGNFINTSNSYGDAVVWTSGPGSATSGSFSSTITTPPSSSQYCIGYVEVFPSTRIPPVSPSINTYNKTSHPSYNMTGANGGALYSWAGTLPSYNTGDLLISFLSIDLGGDITSIAAPTGWSTIYSTLSGDPVVLAYKYATASETNPSFSVTVTSNGSTKTYNGHVQTWSINGSYDTIGAAATNASGGSVNPSVNITNNYSMAMIFLVADHNATTWTQATGGAMSDTGYTAYTNTPYSDMFWETNMSSGTFANGSFSPNNGGFGSTWGIAVSIS
jgi:hypothetical protein